MRPTSPNDRYLSEPWDNFLRSSPSIRISARGRTSVKVEVESPLAYPLRYRAQPGTTAPLVVNSPYSSNLHRVGPRWPLGPALLMIRQNSALFQTVGAGWGRPFKSGGRNGPVCGGRADEGVASVGVAPGVFPVQADPLVRTPNQCFTEKWFNSSPARGSGSFAPTRGRMSFFM
jgi:hypothetical protein